MPQKISNFHAKIYQSTLQWSPEALVAQNAHRILHCVQIPKLDRQQHKLCGTIKAVDD
jgi:hypothetical protein